MSSAHELETEYFRLTETELHLLRSRFAYKKIPLERLQRVELTRGARIKYPMRTLIFGSILLAISAGLILRMKHFPFPMPDETENPKGPIIVLIALGIFIFMGLASVFIATVKTLIMRVSLEDGTIEVFELQSLKKSNKLRDLEAFLKKKLSGNLLYVDTNLHI